MYNLLICSCNLCFIKEFFNRIPNSNTDFRITNIAVNYTEIKNNIYWGFIDGVIIDNYNCNIRIERVMEIMSDSNIYPYPKIIYYTKSKYISKDNNKLFKIIQLNPSINETLDLINLKSILKLKDKDSMAVIEKNLRQELSELGFKLSHKGTNYIIRTSIILEQSNNEEFYCNLEKNVYSIISSENNTSVDNVKSNILKAINYAYKNDIKNKPKPKDLFYYLIEKK